MGFLAGAAVILTLFVILGFNTGAIAVIIGYALVFLLCLSEVFFLIFLFRLAFTKRVSGVFTRIERLPGARYDTALYMTDEGELSNIFPCEFVMRDKFYKSGKTIRLRADRFGGRNRRVFDTNARATIIMGNILCAPVPAALLIPLFMNGDAAAVIMRITLALIGTALTAGEIFFVCGLVRAFRARPVKASFTRLDVPEGGSGLTAFYMTEEGEFPTVRVPGSGVRKAYSTGKEVTGRLDPPGRGSRRVTDKNALAAMIFWAVLCLPIPVVMLLELML